jgi:vacuolar protein sorting-associated protein 26
MNSMNSLFASSKAASIEISLNESVTRRRLGADGATRAVLKSGETLSGNVKVMVAGAKRLEHSGVRIELRGVINARGEKAPYDFVLLVQELSPPGSASGILTLPYSFNAPSLPHDTYAGALAKVHYFLRAIVSTKASFAGASGITRELDFFVENDQDSVALPQTSARATSAADIDLNAALKLEVGIEECLHIEFEYNK